MNFRNFRFNVVGRVLLIMISVVVLLSIISSREFVITSTILALMIIMQIMNLVSYVERTNRKLSVFFDAIRHSDFSSSFSDQGLGKSFDDLNQAFNEVINEFKKTRATKRVWSSDWFRCYWVFLYSDRLLGLAWQGKLPLY